MCLLYVKSSRAGWISFVVDNKPSRHCILISHIPTKYQSIIVCVTYIKLIITSYATNKDNYRITIYRHFRVYKLLDYFNPWNNSCKPIRQRPRWWNQLLKLWIKTLQRFLQLRLPSSAFLQFSNCRATLTLQSEHKNFKMHQRRTLNCLPRYITERFAILPGNIFWAFFFCVLRASLFFFPFFVVSTQTGIEIRA